MAEIKFIPIQASVITAFEISFLNKLFSALLDWDHRSFTIVKIEYEDGQKRLAIDPPTDLDVGDVLVAIGQVEGILQSHNLEEIIMNTSIKLWLSLIHI